MPIVKPISDIQRNINAITEECAQTRQPIYLTKNGNKSLVLMDADAFDEEMALHAEVYDREMRVYKAITRGYEDMLAGRVTPADEAMARARLRRHSEENR